MSYSRLALCSTVASIYLLTQIIMLTYALSSYFLPRCDPFSWCYFYILNWLLWCLLFFSSRSFRVTSLVMKNLVAGVTLKNIGTFGLYISQQIPNRMHISCGFSHVPIRINCWIHPVLTWHLLEPTVANWAPNIKMSSYQYRKSHCEDKTVVL